jgi:hypothetical protein
MNSPSAKRKPVFWMLLFLVPATGCQETAAPRPTAPASNTPPVAMQLAGTSSCSGRACHGNASPVAGQAIQLNEFATWALHDPHVGAYDVLLNERSKKIARNLRIPGEQAENDVRCLACHTNPLAALPDAAPLVQAERRFGVGCESCHGPASGWLVSHTTAEWKKLTVAEKAKQGMYPVQDLAARAEMCAACHVGQPADVAKGLPARDLYHDLLGAGHPRLSFELGSYLSNLAPHWLEKEQEPGHEAKVWAVGQVVSAKSALQLLAERAGNRGRPWPEFAEYDCAACHHDLREPAHWEPDSVKGRAPLGALPWNDWYVTMLPGVLNDRLAAELVELRAQMAKRYPDREKVAQQARDMGRKLSEQQHSLHVRKFDRKAIQQLVASLVQRRQPELRGSWDTTDQLCLALFALTEAAQRDRLHAVELSPLEKRNKINTALQELRDQVTLELNGQRSLRRDAEFRKDLDALLRRLGE